MIIEMVLLVVIAAVVFLYVLVPILPLQRREVTPHESHADLAGDAQADIETVEKQPVHDRS